MPGFEDRGGHVPEVRENPDGSIDAPEGGIQLSEDIVRYRIHGKHWYLHLPMLQWMKGLTTILRNAPMEEGLLRWIASHGSYEGYLEALGKAGQRGTNVHIGIERLLAGETINRRGFTDEEWNHLTTWMNFYREKRPKTLAVEQAVADTRRKIATAIDWRGILDEKHTTLNWKTSSDIFEEAVIQSNEEAIIYNEQGQFDEHGPVVQHGVLRTGTRHKVGYELALLEIDQQRHEYFNHLAELERYKDPDWRPVFPKPQPEQLSIANLPPVQETNGKAHTNGKAGTNGRK